MSASARELKLLELRTGKCPFEAWYKSVRDIRARQRIFSTITRLADPAYRTFKSVGEGVQELRIFHGPGYRVYFGMKGDQLVVLIGGGDKGSQREDINEAKKLWKAFKDESQRYQRKLLG